MSTLEKMKILTDSAQYDLCDYVSHHKSSQINLPGIYEAIGHNGCKIPLFKTLMTNKCKNDCKYCINQSKRNFTRLELSPEELARAFLGYYNRGLVNGLFLSSGISDDVDSTMEKQIETVSLLRKKYGYDDYIHLKVIPGASRDSIKRAMALANRVSINIEAATSSGLAELSSTKDYNKDILKRLSWINSLQHKSTTYPNSTHTTQLIIGANNETDKEILSRMEKIYKKSDLKRTYFSAFTPIEETEFKNKEACSTDRTSKLYNADTLINSYKYNVKELIFDESDKLSLTQDPKILAAKNMNIFPVEINSAPIRELIRVPGIGVKSAHEIVSIRKKKPFTHKEQLQELGVITNRADPYIKINGEYQTTFNF
ncbi:Predicted DNA-binding protein with the Helix-hairpin-helix motif [Methanobrevibacter gottschalkii]|uniref:Predicted DNA-binding protein with the Helix-hairpin-helix motif n=2 Tax=Methanobrevibacter gottschalkii TaxID=190974 RepID=A0A1H7F7S2_9EURY|nr:MULTISPECIES: radical SAM protein [Methanobrevibacter]MCQ2970646.1 radical SAM protein [archaeon]OEC93723.1 radical SAM protein [Methanobrevibacter sp. A27]RPF52830.1 putative DNA-binding helix-hairpin-helix protein [Methanobrevibacter gottschalkii DSM 11977]SEK20050.1 Predicted DNA-binding protein with the Helix-hairpin-helix motif [Methanobrevibacter gottschalkii]